MNFLSVIQSIEGYKNELKRAHQHALSNQLSNEEADGVFEKAELKMNSIVSAIYKGIEFTPGELEYNKPSLISPNTTISTSSIANMVSVVKNSLVKTQESLKDKKYSMIDKGTNKRFSLNNSTKSLFTKTVKDLEALVEIFTPEVIEEEAE